MNKLRRIAAIVALALPATVGLGVVVAAPAQAHTTSTRHYDYCYWTLGGQMYCQRHCSYVERTYYGCVNAWVPMNLWRT